MRDAEAAIAERYRLMAPQLNERQRRRVAAAEARIFGRGGIAGAARACGLAENTVRRGLAELDEPEPLAPDRVRAAGAGRKPAVEGDPKLLEDLRALVEDDVRGDPERVLLWTSRACATTPESLPARGIGPGRTSSGRCARAAPGSGLQGRARPLRA